MESISPTSHWRRTAEPTQTYGPLDSELEADVAIIGAGMTGLAAGMHLKNAGRRVVILEAGRIGAGTSGGTSGHLDAQPDQGARKLISQFGEAAARMATAARMAAIEQIESWCSQLHIECDFQRIPAFSYTEASSRLKDLRQEEEALHSLGLAVSFADGAGLPFPTAGAFRIENQARFHPLKYLNAIAARFHGEGCAIFENSRAEPPRDGSPCTVSTPAGRVTAENVLVCTHSGYFGISELDTRVYPYQSYVLAARVAEEFPDGLFWDDAEPYHYLRLAEPDDRHLVLIGGADHKTGHASEQDALQSLIQYARQRFALLAVESTWSAEFYEPADGLPLIGRVPLTDHLYAATGFSGTGLTFGTLAGKILADLVLERSSPWADLFTPSRLNALAAAPNFLSENLDAAWRFVSDRFAGEAVDAFDEVLPGQGRLVDYHRKQIAAYRDEGGTLHTLSPVCTHAGCHVRWNELEKTWDCPCHGGRYSAVGERIYGPPPHDLERLMLKQTVEG